MSQKMSQRNLNKFKEKENKFYDWITSQLYALDSGIDF